MKNEVMSWLDRQFELQEKLSEQIEVDGVRYKNLICIAPKELHTREECLEQLASMLGVELIESDIRYNDPNLYEKYFIYKDEYRVFALFEREVE